MSNDNEVPKLNTDHNKTPFRDVLGNELHLGHMVGFNAPMNFRWIGRVVEYHPGGVLVSQGNKNGPTGQTPARLRVTFDITLSLQPGSVIIQDLCRVVNPESEQVIQKMLEPGLTQ